jgi:uncharacterized protein
MKSRLFACTCMFLVSSVPTWAADVPTVRARPGVTANNVPSISVAGEAEEQVKPDLAILSMEAADEKPTAAAAAIENGHLTRTVIATLQKYGLSDSDIQAGALDLSPRYRERTDPKSGQIVERTFAGYRASTIYRVQIHNVEDAPRIAREIVEGGSNIYRSMTFEVLNRDERLDALRATALQNALQRAQRYAKSASLELGDIMQIAPVFDPASPSAEGLENANAPIDQVAISVPAHANDIFLHAAVTVSWELKSQTAECDADKERK